MPTIDQSRKMKAYEAGHAASAMPPANTTTLAYGGGVDGVGVTSGTPKVYLVFWGSQWGAQTTDGNGDYTFSGDPAAGAPYIQEMFKGLGTGGELWSGTMTQYCDGPLVSLGATSCPYGAAFVGYPKGGALAGVWYDNSSAEPFTATQDQIANEAVRAASHFGNTAQGSNRYNQYFVLSAHNTNPDGFQTSGFCAWHDYTGDPGLAPSGAVNSPSGDVAFTNMPYVMDAAAGCGQGIVNSPGLLDGYSIVAGHEYAETITDQNPVGGWSNPNPPFNENGDDCGFNTTATMADVTFATGTFAMQPTWSNDTNQCAISHPLYSALTAVTGDSQSTVIGSAYPTTLEANVSNANGPVSGVQVTFTAPASGPSVTFGGSCSGTTCKVTTDSQGNAAAPVVTANSTPGSFSITTSSSYYLTTLATFRLYNLASAPSQMSIVSGDVQSAGVGTAYAHPLMVKVTDSGGAASPYVPVTFAAPPSGASASFGTCSGGNPANGCTVKTDLLGDATSSVLTANPTLGTFSVTATASGITPQSFSLTNVAGPPASVAPTSGAAQQTLAAGRFASPLSVHVADQFGHPVSGARVTFSAPASGPTATFGACTSNPTANQCAVTTDSSGNASSSSMTAGAAPGGFAITASVAGAPAAQFAETVAQSGYWTVASDGGIFSFGGAPFAGSEGGQPLNKPIVGMAVAPGGGYYMVASDGGIFSFGGAPFYGSEGGQPLNKPIVGMAAVPGGYYLVASDGGIFSFGPGATFYGSEGGQPLNKPIVGMAAPAGGGYYLVASDGGIFSFGPGATFYGSQGGQPLNKPIVGMAAAPGGGYYLVASDGGIFTFGPGAVFQGSMGGHPLNKPIVGMSVDPATGGYWLDASDGGIFTFNTPFYGSMGGTPLNQPMVGMAPSAVIGG